MDTLAAQTTPPLLTVSQRSPRIWKFWGTTLWGCAFEDFLTRRFEPDGRNPVETYLKRRGWKESAAARRYMTALQTSVMSPHHPS